MYQVLEKQVSRSHAGLKALMPLFSFLFIKRQSSERGDYTIALWMKGEESRVLPHPELRSSTLLLCVLVGLVGPVVVLARPTYPSFPSTGFVCT